MSLDHGKLKRTRAGARSGTTWKPKDGDQNKVFVLPPRSAYLNAWDQMGDLAIPYDVHYFPIDGRKPTETSRCLRQLKQQCPACDMFWAWQKSEDPGMKELAKQVKPTTQYLFNMLDINNLQAGIQPWASNFTCWDKIMAIAANPGWGNVVDPAGGIIFNITLTPKGRSKSGYNQYEVIPEPGHVTVMDNLQAIPDWQEVLDSLEENVPGAKTADEIRTLLDAMGFPPTDGQPRRAPTNPTPSAPTPTAPAPAPTSAAPRTVAPAGPKPVAAAVPVPLKTPAAVRPVPAPVAAPKPVGAAPAPARAPAPVAAVPSAGPVAEDGYAAVHYDPGEDFVPVVDESERPAGSPRCYGTYGEQHRMPDGSSACQPCPVVTDCQLRMLGIQG